MTFNGIKMDKNESKKLFIKYFKIGPVGPKGWIININMVNNDTLQAFGIVVKVPGFDVGEQVIFDHLYDEIWRVTSKDNDHGHPVFLGEDYGGYSIGS